MRGLVAREESGRSGASTQIYVPTQGFTLVKQPREDRQSHIRADEEWSAIPWVFIHIVRSTNELHF